MSALRLPAGLNRRTLKVTLWAVILTAAAVAVFVNVRKPADDPLFHDPMADAQVAGAARTDRAVYHPKPVTSTSKNQEPLVLQTFQSAGPGPAAAGARDDLVRQAKAAGWVFNPSEPDSRGGMIGAKTIEGKDASISVYFSSDNAEKVILVLRY